jgi:hypothetical protein
MTWAEMRAGLDQLPTWALEQKAAANRWVIAVTRQRLAPANRCLGCIRSRTGLAGALGRGRRGGGYPVVAASRRMPSSPALILSTAASSVNPDRAQQHGPFPADQGMVTRRVICPLLSQ